jgi:[ribosomal protein S18]-alanine N-acetyltransferase
VKLWMAPGGLHVEPGIGKDAGAMARLHATAFYHGWPVSEFDAYLADPGRTPAYVAIDPKRRLAGFAMLRLVEDEAELLTIVVDGKWRGRGVGAAMLRAALDDLTMSPVRRMFLEVEDANAAAISLYKTFGFAEIAQRRGYYPKPGGEPATALVMRRELD